MIDFLLEFVFAAGVRLIDQCELARQCEVEVVRIAVRTQNVLGTLKDAREHFERQAGLEASLLELKAVFESVHSLVGRCGVPVSLTKRASLMWQKGNPNKLALVNAEKRLEQITQVRYFLCRYFGDFVILLRSYEYHRTSPRSVSLYHKRPSSRELYKGRNISRVLSE